jgi:hypothetical protein
MGTGLQGVPAANLRGGRGALNERQQGSKAALSQSGPLEKSIPFRQELRGHPWGTKAAGGSRFK